VSDCRLAAPEGPLVVPPASGTGTVWFSLVVPTYNERANIEPLVEQVIKALDEKYAGRYEAIFVDDNSPDGTAAAVERVSRRFRQVKLVVRTGERGLATAVVRGWQKSAGSVLGVMDGDLQHPPEVLADILTRIEGKADLVLASRYCQLGGTGSWGWARRLASKIAAMFSLIVLPEAVARVGDPLSGCFAFRREVIAGVKLAPEGYKILLEVLARGRAQAIEETPYDFRLRRHGKTKATCRQLIEYLVQLMRLRLHRWGVPGGRQ